MRVFLGLRAVDKVYLERHGRQIAALVVLRLHRVAQLGVALVFALSLVASVTSFASLTARWIHFGCG